MEKTPWFKKYRNINPAGVCESNSKIGTCYHIQRKIYLHAKAKAKYEYEKSDLNLQYY